jgi:hypothetical protein
MPALPLKKYSGFCLSQYHWKLNLLLDLSRNVGASRVDIANLHIITI